MGYQKRSDITQSDRSLVKPKKIYFVLLNLNDGIIEIGHNIACGMIFLFSAQKKFVTSKIELMLGIGLALS